ncbi:poly-gamma-glutamate synthesis protein (capsule biosynthesis protein) [Cytobacillus eiseniae]|uniref:Poly-gamma-glutamate synthesis protein (Capsule biosynthesis protein) n=1 Tax=Cytobacillus eiseniae TaxID=762947 RepID=A0ABS4RIU9_9BACI|nr:CapA family protein [Cytobacillus eiseniae]MBP2242280.1 poly-gamma-glutamate synthesis protein (capsule biosynthesis protein) [Cytobacillus eiseniae]
MSKKTNLFISISLCTSLILFASFLIFHMYNESKEKEQIIHSIQAHATKQCFMEAKTYSEIITLGAIGDILIHDWVYNDAKTETGYDFTPMFQDVKTLLQQPDILLANQETILGGTKIGISSYPMFNSPQEVGDALIDAGVDIVSTANNHSLDKGERGIIASLDYMDKINLPNVGTYRDDSSKQELQILTNKRIKVAYLSYTYGTNGIPVPSGKDYLVNLIDKEAMKEEIHRANNKADVIVMSIHWGNEYQRYPTVDQKELAQFLVDEGVDIIFGHHPHVLQPMEWLTTADGTDALVVYSLGNFLSGQNNKYKDIGGMATINVTKTIDQSGTSIKLTNPNFFPTYVYKVNKIRNYRIIPLENAGNFGMENAKGKYEEIQQHMLGNL